MITRGYLLGEIVDSLSTVSQQVDTRCTLGLTDLNKFLEDFFLQILNEALGYDLVNLNDDRSNAPGIDLLDETRGVAFQITSTRNSKKINETLGKADKLKKLPEKIYILIIGKKQKSYSLKPELCDPFEFDDSYIWDINTLCQKLVVLPIDTLQRIYDYVRKELARVRIELELPNEEGKYPTSINDYIENIPKPVMTEFTEYYDYMQKNSDAFELELNEVKEDFKILATELSKLPRITREFLSFLFQRRDDEASDYHSNYRFNYNRLKRICSFPDFEGEITLLKEHGFADINEPDDFGESPYVTFGLKGKSENFTYEFFEYIKSKAIGFSKPLVNLDFSKF